MDLRRRRTGSPSARTSQAFDRATVMAQSALHVDHRTSRPTVVGPKARGPDDRADLAAPRGRAATVRGGDRRRCGPRGRGRRCPRSGCCRAQSSKEFNSRSSLRSASENMLRSPPENRARPSRTRRPPCRPISTPRSAEGVEIKRCARSRCPTSWGEGSRRACSEITPTWSYRSSQSPDCSIHHSTSRPGDRYAAAGRATRRPRVSPVESRSHQLGG